MFSTVKFPKPPVQLRGKQSFCTNCGLLFRAVSSFDSHRVGGWDDRRCLTSAQLADKGFKQDASMFWRAPGRKGPLPANWRKA